MVESPPDAQRWNHNIHYHRVLLDAVPTGARTALDIGCGDGLLVRQLAGLVDHVIGVDVDAASIATARATPHPANVEFILGDALTLPLERGSFDAVTAVAVLHHLDCVEGLTRMRELVRPGGMLGVVGLAASSLPQDALWELAAVTANVVLRARRAVWDHGAPTVWPPPNTYREVRAAADAVLPGHRYRRRLLWRYTLVWHKPA